MFLKWKLMQSIALLLAAMPRPCGSSSNNSGCSVALSNSSLANAGRQCSAWIGINVSGAGFRRSGTRIHRARSFSLKTSARASQCSATPRRTSASPTGTKSLHSARQSTLKPCKRPFATMTCHPSSRKSLKPLRPIAGCSRLSRLAGRRVSAKSGRRFLLCPPPAPLGGDSL
jgi:hypothetical protein